MKKLLFVLLGLSFALFSCKKDEENPVQKFDISFSGNTLKVPSNATILLDGKQYQGSASVAKNRLVAIIAENKAYIYYTGMGNANLNDSTSRRAIGYLMFSDFLQEKSGQALELSTGIRVEQSGNQYTFTNVKKRFAAIERPGNTDYLFQRGEAWPSIDWMQAVKGNNPVSFLEFDNVTYTNISRVKTYGATIRLLPLSNNLLTWKILADKNTQALNAGADPTILAYVNFIDFSYVTLKAVSELISGIPVPFLDCWAAYVADVFGDVVFSTMIQLLTNDNHISKQNWENTANDLLNGFFGCVISNGIEITGVGMVLEQALDILSTGQWIIDNALISSLDILSTSAYEPWQAGNGWDLFKTTFNYYKETDNLEQAVINEFGSSYRIADWNDVVAYCQNNSPGLFISNLNWQLGEENSLMVVRNGQHFWAGSRHYYISRFDHNKPSHYLAHANINNHHIDLGSWYGLNMPVLCIKK
ncbi:MAG: hypothetical protein U1C46_12130 [Bacteroidales bacterium]|nr:hypothetical protein [Bacteroidales bacterium]